MKILAALRSVYLYSALSIAVGAVAVAAVLLLSLLLELAGLASAPPTTDSIRERVSIAAAILIFALPVGAIHLWMIRGSLGDAAERIAGARHFYLNAWIVAGLTAATMSVFDITQRTIVLGTKDVGASLSALVVSIAVAFAAWRWREATPGARRLWQVIGAFTTLLAATVLGVMTLLELMAALTGLVTGRDRPYYPPSEAAWAATIGLLAALAMWGIGLRWQWRWRDLTFRTIYSAVGFAVGLLLLSLTGTDEVARLIAVGRGAMNATEVARFWTEPAIGVYLVALHLPWLLADRARIDLPTRVTDRLVRGITALVGLIVLAMALIPTWSYLAQEVLHLGPAGPQGNIPLGDGSVAATAVGLLLYVPAWTLFLRSTRADVRSSLRRAYVLTVVCLSLLVTIFSGVISASNAISLALGAPASDPKIRATIDLAGVAVGLALLLAAHLWLLLRDMARARALPGAVATVRPAVDPLVSVLEEVAAGRTTPRAAAARIRAMHASPHATQGRIA